MYMIKLFGAVMLTMAVGAVASPLIGEDIFTREEEDPDCCGTGYSISVCSDTAACSGYTGACCPVVFNGVSAYVVLHHADETD